jgi:hypothetical protein
MTALAWIRNSVSRSHAAPLAVIRRIRFSTLINVATSSATNGVVGVSGEARCAKWIGTSALSVTLTFRIETLPRVLAARGPDGYRRRPATVRHIRNSNRRRSQCGAVVSQWLIHRLRSAASARTGTEISWTSGVRNGGQVSNSACLARNRSE